ncbi:hypothetical protein DXG01_001626 [Tephrocybe rancida]|nr:hypothetical protein DXG01_001626 [Tephrocybe rancida]
MSSPFLFKPRALAKPKPKPVATQHVLPHASSSSTSIPQIHPPPSTSTSITPVTKPKFSNEDYTSLFSLALSDYALWADSDLRRALDFSRESDEEGAGGFFPLTQLLKRSKVLAPLALENVQVQIVKALRAEGKVDVRLLVSEPSASTWGGQAHDRRDLGAYEIRRRETAGEVGGYSKLDWENRTIYVENIPSPHRTLPSILHFIYTLLPKRPSSQNALTPTRIQALTFPPHHQDKPNALPTCKGFALVVLADIADVEFMLESWPWDRRHAQEASKDQEGSEAMKFGFRTLSKARWDQLKDEYIVYRARLVEEINAHQDAVEPLVPMSVPTSTSIPTPPPVIAEPQPEPKPEANPPPLAPNAPYPPGVLVFIRNLHPETNKTTLRRFFARTVPDSALDYVDFTKGMDFCHLRLAAPTHAQVLMAHFTDRPTAQLGGLDDTGGDGGTPVRVELVEGTRERVYWEKVPEKIRREAVRKALGDGAGGEKGGGESEGRRKRQKR